MHDFVLALIGGGMIGLAAVILMAAEGRVMGLSGIVSSLSAVFANTPKADQSWRFVFMAGVVAAPILSTAMLGDRPAFSLSAEPPLLIISGLIVGFGAVIGDGCTSGHGVCGLARLSGRSMAATAVFMTTAIATVFIANAITGR